MPIKSNNHHVNQSHQHQIEIKPKKIDSKRVPFFRNLSFPSTTHGTWQELTRKIFISHIPVLNFAGTDYTSHVCQPWTNVAKTHHKTSDPKIFISHIPVLNFAGAALHVTPRMWANPSWANVPRHTTNFNPKMFISHIPVSNFAWTTRKRWHHASVPTLNQCCKDTPQNLRP